MKKLCTLAAVLAFALSSGNFANAGEPNLGSLGLGSMKTLSHSQAKMVRGQTRRSTNTVNVTGRTFDAKVGGVIVVGGVGGGGGFLGGIAGVGSLSTATSSYNATGTSSATGWSASQARLVGGSFATSTAIAN